MSQPTVSVVLAVYNATWCIARALDSVVAQEVPPLEILVCDDGSTDGTPEFVEQRYGARVRVLRLPHRNASAARSQGLGEAKGEWLSFLDADDWWTTDKLLRQLEYIERHPDVRWISTDGTYLSEAGILRESWLSDYFAPVTELHGDLFARLVQRCFPLMSSMLVERDAYHAVGGMDASIVYSHDYDLWLRLAANCPGAVMAERLVFYWSHPNALSRRYEGRYRDNLMLLERIARGEVGRDPRARELAARRAASDAFDLGMLCLRSDRADEGRPLLRRSLARGPLRRRALAVAGLCLPGGALPLLRRAGWLKQTLTSARAKTEVVRPEEGT